MWDGLAGVDSKLRQVIQEVSFKLVGRAVAQGGVETVKVEVRVEVVSHLQPSFFETGKRAAMRQQLGFERAPARLGLGVVGGITRPSVTGHRPGRFDALAALHAGVLAAALGMENEARGQLAQR
jgi:hypothetical protein